MTTNVGYLIGDMREIHGWLITSKKRSEKLEKEAAKLEESEERK